MKKTIKKPTKKELASMPLHSDADVKRYIGFLNEAHDGDNLKTIREGISGMDERMNRGFNEVNEKLDKHERILSRHEFMLHEHSQILGRLIVDVEEIKSGMREKIDRKEFTALEKRMVALEAYVFSGKTSHPK